MPRRRILLIGLAGLAFLAPAAQARDLGTRPLARGDRGSDVRQLQRALTRVRAARLRADGAFGPRTRRAVLRYERRERLTVDGRVSTGQARGLLRRAHMPVPPPAPTAAPRAATPAGVFPVQGEVRWGDGFGDRGGEHQGIDLMSACGTPLVAMRPSTVRVRRTGGAAGHYLVLTTEDGDDHVYMHLRDVAVHTGDTVAAGGAIGTVGQTGNATACHLHFERWTAPGWYRGGEASDPEPLLRAAAPAAVSADGRDAGS